jgi:hypothetical protein
MPDEKALADRYACNCPETSYLRAQWLPIPRHHRCAYVAARNKLVDQATNYAYRHATKTTFTAVYVDEMQRLVEAARKAQLL